MPVHSRHKSSRAPAKSRGAVRQPQITGARQGATAKSLPGKADSSITEALPVAESRWIYYCESFVILTKNWREGLMMHPAILGRVLLHELFALVQVVCGASLNK